MLSAVIVFFLAIKTKSKFQKFKIHFWHEIKRKCTLYFVFSHKHNWQSCYYLLIIRKEDWVHLDLPGVFLLWHHSCCKKSHEVKWDTRKWGLTVFTMWYLTISCRYYSSILGHFIRGKKWRKGFHQGEEVKERISSGGRSEGRTQTQTKWVAGEKKHFFKNLTRGFLVGQQKPKPKMIKHESTWHDKTRKIYMDG